MAKRTLVGLLFLILLFGCVSPQGGRQVRHYTSSTGIRFEGGDGSSMEKAIILKGASSSLGGVPAEYEWIRDNLPGCKVRMQSFNKRENKMYDVMICSCSDGRTETVYFDITDFFGKKFRKR